MSRKISSILIMSFLLVLLAACGATNQGQQEMETDELVLLDSSQHPEVTIEMSNGGIIKIELYPEVAPNTVNNFIALVQDGYYDGLIFHRVIPDFMIQGGDPTA